MTRVNDFRWKHDMTVRDLVDQLGTVGYQSVELKKAANAIINMQRDGATTYFTFTSNMVTSGLRGLFAQVIEEGIADVVITTVGAIEEDIMRSMGEDFTIDSFNPDDITLYEKGRNRIGNITIENESYMRFETTINQMLASIYEEQARITPSELLRKLGERLDDDHSILAQAAANDVPVFCPAITDGAFGFHLFLLQQDHDDFIIDVVKDFENVLYTSSQDERKAIIALGGGTSKHHAILSSLLNGGLDYAVYMTTARRYSGSIGGATTDEAKSWGKIRGDGDAATVIGDVTITFPLAIVHAFEQLNEEGFL